MSVAARRFTRLSAAVALALLTAAGVAFAATSITTPSGSSFTVPGDAAGNPLPFTVVATGFNAGSLVNIEQCDGKSPADPTWSVTGDCDLGSAPAAVLADAGGVATFDVASANHAFHPFKGESPQSLFNCLSPNDPAMNPLNGLDDYRSCRIRVSTNNNAVTADQTFLTIELPDAVQATTTTVAPTTTSTTAATTSTSTTSPGSTSTTTVAPSTSTTSIAVSTSTTSTSTTSTSTSTSTTTTTVKPTTTSTSVTTTTAKPTTTSTVAPTTTTIGAQGTTSSTSASSTSTTVQSTGETSTTVAATGVTVAAGSSLPRTGSSGDLPMLGIGIVLVGAGLGLATRRHRTA